MSNQASIQPSPAGHHPSALAPSATPTQLHHQPIRPSLYPAGHQPGYATQHYPSPIGHYGTPTGHGHAMARSAHAPALAYKAPDPSEVWHLPEAAQQSIPADVRAQFQTDHKGRLLLFTTPPQMPGPPPSDGDEKKGERKVLRHSAKYLAFRAQKERERLEAKRKREEEEDATGGANESEREGEARAATFLQDVSSGKRPRLAAQHDAASLNGAPQAAADPDDLLGRALKPTNPTLMQGLMNELTLLYPYDPNSGMNEEEWSLKVVREQLELAEARVRAAEEAQQNLMRQQREAAAQRCDGEGDVDKNGKFRWAGPFGHPPPNAHLEWK